MWVEHTYWDEILLSGPIPGSATSPNQGVNMTCVYHVGSPSGPILEPDEDNLESNDLDVAHELNSLKALGIHTGISSKEEKLAEKHATKEMHTSSLVSVVPQSKLNCPITSYSDSKFVNPFSNSCSNMSTFSNKKKWYSSQKFQKFKISQSELFNAFILILIIVLGFQVYRCPFRSSVVNKAFNLQTR